MNTTIAYVVGAVLALCFVIGGVAAWQASKEKPLPAVEFSSPFRPEEGPGGLSKEYISVKNSGDSSVDLTGWTLSNDEGDTFTFPESFILSAGTAVTVYSGCAEDVEEPAGLYWCAHKPVWRDLAGVATLRMPDATVVDIHKYKTQCETCGKK